VSHDFVEGGAVRDTLRLDFDGSTIAGGWSPGLLNWDDGVRADEAGVDTTPPEGIEASGKDAVALARLAADWFEDHRSNWQASKR
jgi:hypothetical protein